MGFAGTSLEDFPMTFTRPWLLLLLLAAPYVLMTARGLTARRGVTALRFAGVVFLALAAAGPRITAPSDRVEAVFVLDVSESLGGRGVREGLEEINRLLSGMRGDDAAGLVSVAAEAVVETSPRPGGSAFETTARHDGGASRLSEGLYAGIASMTRRGESRVVLVSDGKDTEGDLEDAVRYAAASGTVVDVLPIGPPPGREVLVEELQVPRRVSEGEVHELSVVIRSEQSTAGRLVILRDGEYLGEDRFQLGPGVRRRSYEMPGSESGDRVYEVILDAASDSSPDNNRGLGVTSVEGTPRILWSGRGASAAADALELQGFTVDRLAPGDLPDSVGGLSAWDAVILDNVSARELSLQTMDILETWVRTRGGGLMMAGGDSSFGLGGWQGTPVERALPVEMDAPASLYIPSLSMVMVIDKSGSMGGDAGGGMSKLDVVKDAVLGAVEVLNPLYTVGLVAFDADVEWTIPMTEAGNKAVIRSGLAGLDYGGGTVLYPAIREAYERLIQSPSAVRHLVILSDGLAEHADFDEMASAIVRDGITVSTVAVGADADIKLMKQLAETGGGRYWFAEDATQVPRIFASESMIVSRGLTVEETVFPNPVTPAEALDGIDLTLLPPLHGYVMTHSRTTAVEALRSPRGHPLLVYGTHGLGRTVAFTSDLRAGWGRDWVRWEDFPIFMAQTVRWMRRNPGIRDMDLSMIDENGGVTLVLEARTADGGFRTDLKPTGRIVTPDLSELSLPMGQTGPGRYEGWFSPREDGIYDALAADETAGILDRTWWTRAYAPELSAPGVDMAVLSEAARIGGGRVLTQDENPDDWWKVRSPKNETLADLTAWLALTALVLFLADIALRESEFWHRKREMRRTGEPADMEELILRGLDDERHKPTYRRPTPAEAARILAERRQKREADERRKRS
jgi:Ca-activated chloride channel family protein